MLSLLQIENIAVIERSEITFQKGLNVLTGETGAGKSIVMDAISAVLGRRTNRDLIRTGSEKAAVTAVFSAPAASDWYETHGVPYDPEELLIRRELYADGKNVCRVNGAAVTVSVLRALGASLVDIHGQNDTQALFDEKAHLALLDAFADTASEQDAYHSAYVRCTEIRTQLDRVSMDESEKLRRMESLTYQINEITDAKLKAGEEEPLLARRNVLRNAEKLSDGLSEAVKSLYGGESSQGASDLLSAAARELTRLGRFDAKYEEAAQRLSSLIADADSLSEELRSDLDELSYSDEELDRIERRLDLIERLCRKYGKDAAAVLEYAETAQNELEAITTSEERSEALREELRRAEAEAMRLGEILRSKRREGAVLLKERVEDELSQLDMPNIRFSARFTEIPLSDSGIDQVSFYMSANLGEDEKPLNKVASGGELSRVMLALKNVLAENDTVPTMIFDEVDAGVSGRAAQKVAEKLKRSSTGKQVLCVTHLPQIAALADVHFLITKQARDGRTYTQVAPLDRPGRVEELARIIGGSQITENTRKSAEDMLGVS
ncbi:MAG: DNA repair protein RecN [Oscillospiraceae bacterium]|nr:DNA repair protein RecN [Oscillospiraceae bacterium]